MIQLFSVRVSESIQYARLVTEFVAEECTSFLKWISNIYLFPDKQLSIWQLVCNPADYNNYKYINIDKTNDTITL